MHTNSGTGSLGSTAVTLTVPASGFYDVGAVISAPGLSVGQIGITVTPPRHPPVSAAATPASAQGTTGAPVYLEPGDAVTYTVNPNGAGNSNMTPWTVAVSVTQATELAS